MQKYGTFGLFFLVILLCSESDNRIGNYYFLFAWLQIDKYDTQVLLYYSKININLLNLCIETLEKK